MIDDRRCEFCKHWDSYDGKPGRFLLGVCGYKPPQLGGFTDKFETCTKFEKAPAREEAA